jgi:hypothetical protein
MSSPSRPDPSQPPPGRTNKTDNEEKADESSQIGIPGGAAGRRGGESWGLGGPRHGARIVRSKAGFTTVVAVDFGPDGLLYVLELSDGPGNPNLNLGKVVRVKHSGEIEEVITGLSLPTGMTFGPDGRLYISNFGAAPPGLGTVLRFDIALGW